MKRRWESKVPKSCECGKPNEAAGVVAGRTNGYYVGITGCPTCRTIERSGYDRGPETQSEGDGKPESRYLGQRKRREDKRNEFLPAGLAASIALGCARFWKARGMRDPVKFRF